MVVVPSLRRLARCHASTIVRGQQSQFTLRSQSVGKLATDNVLGFQPKGLCSTCNLASSRIFLVQAWNPIYDCDGFDDLKLLDNMTQLSMDPKSKGGRL